MKNKILVGLALVTSALASTVAMASTATDAMTNIATEANGLIDAAWPIAVSIVVAGVGIKLFTKFANKAS